MTMPTPDQIAAVLDQLGRGPALVRQIIYEVPPELRKRRPAPGVWSAHEHAVHLPEIYPLVMRRLEQMLTEPAPHIKSYEPSRDEPDGALLMLDLDVEMDRFDRERAALISRLRTLSPEQWAIAATHDEYLHYGVFIMFRHIALHDLHHSYKIEDRLLRKHWDTPLETFLGLVHRSCLLNVTELNNACGDFDRQRTDDNAIGDLCDQLIANSALTRWQCDKLRLGKWKGFYLDDYCLLSKIGQDEYTGLYLAKQMSNGKRVELAVSPLESPPGIKYTVTRTMEE